MTDLIAVIILWFLCKTLGIEIWHPWCVIISKGISPVSEVRWSCWPTCWTISSIPKIWKHLILNRSDGTCGVRRSLIPMEAMFFAPFRASDLMVLSSICYHSPALTAPMLKEHGPTTSSSCSAQLIATLLHVIYVFKILLRSLCTASKCSEGSQTLRPESCINQKNDST